jgi:DNA-binding winged helix-turn-helix (wHTH) protein
VLLYLAERPGVLVTREELLDAVWPGVAVTPDTLTKSIGELRRASSRRCIGGGFASSPTRARRR